MKTFLAHRDAGSFSKKCLRKVFKQQHFPISDFIWDFGKLPFPSHLGKYVIKIGKISTKIHEILKIKTIFGLGMTPK